MHREYSMVLWFLLVVLFFPQFLQSLFIQVIVYITKHKLGFFQNRLRLSPYYLKCLQVKSSVWFLLSVKYHYHIKKLSFSSAISGLIIVRENFCMTPWESFLSSFGKCFWIGKPQAITSQNYNWGGIVWPNCRLSFI